MTEQAYNAAVEWAGARTKTIFPYGPDGAECFVNNNDNTQLRAIITKAGKVHAVTAYGPGAGKVSVEVTNDDNSFSLREVSGVRRDVREDGEAVADRGADPVADGPDVHRLQRAGRDPEGGIPAMSYSWKETRTMEPANPAEPLRLLLVEERFDFLFGVLRRFMPDSWMPFLEHFGSQLKGRKVVRITIEAVE